MLKNSSSWEQDGLILTSKLHAAKASLKVLSLPRLSNHVFSSCSGMGQEMLWPSGFKTDAARAVKAVKAADRLNGEDGIDVLFRAGF